MDIERKQTDGAAVDAETACRELTLALLFLNRMREVVDKGEPPVWRAWKGYDFGVLDELEKEGLVWSGRRSKSVCFTKEGLAAARRVLGKYGIGDWPKWA
jgi:hypothetical protein